MLCEEVVAISNSFEFFPVAAHEAGHCVAGAIIGKPARYATISLSGPHTMYVDDDGDTRVVASIFRTIAGHVGAAVATSSCWSPSWPLLAGYIDRARADDALIGHCDFCADAKLLVEHFPHLTDEGLVQNWREMFRIAFDCFYEDEVRGAMLSVARALLDKTLLGQDEIAEIVAGYNLPTSEDVLPCNA